MIVAVMFVLLLGLPLACSYMMPPFSSLQSNYPGDVNYGGSFSNQDVLNALGLYNSHALMNDTCALRMSTALNLSPGHQIRRKQMGSLNGTGGMYYFYETGALIQYLRKTYGVPLTITPNSTVAYPFRGLVGIMFVNVSRTEAVDHCPVLLWDGLGFYQGKGVINHKDLEATQLWEAPTAGCSIDLNLQQQPSCFPSKSMVELRSGENVPISQVTIGDQVKTYSKEGELVFSPVVTFLDQIIDYKGYYYIITTESKTNLTLSEAHLVFKTIPLRDPQGISHRRSVHASQIRTGDYVLVHHPKKRKPVAEMVIAVSLAQSQGAFAPVTQEGTMIVDGVWVSCYADIVDHELAHSLMVPLNGLYSLAPRMLGARGKYAHGYLKGVLRPIGIRLFGKEKFFNE